MRAQDYAKLEAPFSPSDDPELAFPKAVGIDLAEIEQLYREIFDDLDDKVFGVGWWAPHPGTQRRILISNYLLECVRSIRTNLTEAALHLMEAADHWDKEGNFLGDCVALDQNGNPTFKIPKRAKPADDLARRMATLHTVGFSRALVGAMDCLGASIVGVLGLPISINFADFSRARVGLKKSQDPTHLCFLDKLEKCLAAAGPAGWVTWSLDLRNMVVHKGRRIHTAQVIPRAVSLLGPDGKVIPRATISEHLPSDPCRSQVEAFLDTSRSPTLTEHAELTLQGILSSSIETIRQSARELIKIWALRRKTPTLIKQPKENWPTLPGASHTGFDGYRPGSTPCNFKQWSAHPDIHKLIVASALSDDTRSRWDEFD